MLPLINTILGVSSDAVTIIPILSHKKETIVNEMLATQKVVRYIWKQVVKKQQEVDRPSKYLRPACERYDSFFAVMES